MPNESWFVHLQGENLGPLSTEKLIAMLNQNRVQFADFAWRSGYTKWIRISEIDAFAAHLPAYPKVGIPEDSGASSTKPEAPAPKAAKSKPAPAPEPEPESVKPAPAPVAAKKLESRYLRIPMRGEVVTTGHGKFQILNIAERGVFVAANEPLEIGTDLQFRLESPDLDEALQMRGVVIRHGTDQERPGFAIEFTRLNPIHKTAIEQYVRKKSEEHEN